MKNNKKVIPVCIAITAITAFLAVSPLTRSTLEIKAATDNGANIERSLTVTHFDYKGLWYYNNNTTTNYGFWEKYCLYQLENPGSYGAFHFNISASNASFNKDGILMEFTPYSGYLDFPIKNYPVDYYLTEEDMTNRTNRLNQVNYKQLNSITIQMSENNEGKLIINEGEMTYNAETDTYVISNFSSYASYFVDCVLDEKLISIESFTFNYVC